MDDELRKKKAGSRRWKLAPDDYLRPRDANGHITPTNSVVGIDFVCTECGEVLGQFRMSTTTDGPEDPFMLELKNGHLPEDKDHPKALLICKRCKRDKQISIEKVTKALTLLWAPGARRVVTHKV